MPTLAWLPLDDKCSTGSIVGHAPCLPDPPYLCLSFVKRQKKIFVFGISFDFRFQFWFAFFRYTLSFAKSEDCILIFICNCSCIFIWILPCKPARPFLYAFLLLKPAIIAYQSLYFDLDSCHAPCQTLPIYAFHLSKPAKSIAPVLIKQFPNPHYP